jgi:hypothetical protein
MSDLMWWSLVVRASASWVIVGVWCECVVIVRDGISVWRLCVFGEVVWWLFCWRGLVGGGGDIVVYIVLVHVSRCDVCPWWSRLGVCIWGVS